MPLKRAPTAFARSFPLIAVLCVQALLLFHNLDLLPVWGDEVFTLRTVSHSLREIVTILEHDIHPPLYYFLLHWWARLPLPWTGVAALRAFSACAALLCTILLDYFCLRRWKPSRRWLALALFAFSPCLLLYGRMARSYAMQTALALMAISLLWRWIREPHLVVRRGLPPLVAVVLLLYTHYLPGIAILAAFTLTGWRRLGWTRVAAFAAAAAAAYAPWIVTLAGALRTWGQGSSFHYALAPNFVIEHGLKAGSALVSLTIGESFAVISLLLVPIALALAWRGCRARSLGPRQLPFLLTAAVIAYAGAARWVAWPFIAARLLWLLPFLTVAIVVGLSRLRAPVRAIAATAILLSFASSIVLYFRRENFVNLGYTAPVREIAARVTREATPADIVLIDGYNVDAPALHFYAGPGLTIFDVSAPTAATALAAVRGARAVWSIRNPRDVSPGHIVAEVENEACKGRTRAQSEYNPYAPWQRAALRAVTGHAPDSLYQVTVCGGEGVRPVP